MNDGQIKVVAGRRLQHDAVIMESARPRHPVSDELLERVPVRLAQSDRTKIERIAETKRVSLAWVLRDEITKNLECNERPAA